MSAQVSIVEDIGAETERDIGNLKMPNTTRTASLQPPAPSKKRHPSVTLQNSVIIVVVVLVSYKFVIQ
jgi:hypothetical protein